MSALKIIECPRDAMQGWPHAIATDVKVKYLNALLRVGFDTLDCGSFVSPKAIPQMADTKEVIPQLRMDNSATRLLVIVANQRGAEEAVCFDEISYLGFPFSISPTFQMRNTNSTIETSVERLETIQDLCLKNNKQLVVYLSMGFGNPYGDAYSEETLLHWAAEMVNRQVEIISLADTVGLATPGQIEFALKTLIPKYPQVNWGVHLHAAPGTEYAKLQAAYDAGCTRFDGAMKGIGGCPMADDELVGNMDTERMIAFFETKGLPAGTDAQALSLCSQMAMQVFV
jgi:hydroxymethylglutaryl-CoA lyase